MTGIALLGAAASVWTIVRAQEEKRAITRCADDVKRFSYDLSMFEAAVRQIGDGILLLGANGKFVLINDEAKQILGIEEQNFDDADYDGLVSGFSEKLEKENLLKSASEGKREERIEYKGSVYMLKTAPLGTPDERIGIIATLSDITESFKAENMQTDFVANVSHELKTPLTSVRLYTETLLSGGLEDTDTAREYLEIIDSEADRMERLVRDLLMMTRMDYSQQAWEKSEYDIAVLVKMSLKKLDMSAKAKALAVNRMFDEDLSVMVEMDRDRMEQVILNLLSNAIKYTDEKGRIDADIIDMGNCVQIVISDNGIGIPEKALTRVFERFYRVDQARSRKRGGSGLGLAISKQIVDGHGGTIAMESKYGKGTTVTVTLPLKKKATEAENLEQPSPM